MDEVNSTLTVYFDDPFWVGVYERIFNGKMQAAKITFGAEPKDYEVYDFLLKNFYALRFSPTVSSKYRSTAQINPKRMQRAINNQMQKKGVGTKAQEALKLQHEQSKIEFKVISRENKELEEEKRFALRQVKKKEKHRGH